MPRQVSHLLTAALLCVPLTALPAGKPIDTTPCAAGLAPNISALKADEKLRLIYLRTITEEHYETAKKDFGATYSDLFGATYQEFSQKRQKYFEHTKLDIDYAKSLSVYVEHLSDAARQQYFKCVADLYGRAELQATFTAETARGATLQLSYRDQSPGARPLKLRIDLDGATVSRLTPRTPLAVNGSYSVVLRRRSPSRAIAVAVNSNVGFSTTTMSLPPAQPMPAVRIATIPPITWNRTVTGNGHQFTCTANGLSVGTTLDCHDVGSCGSAEGNKMMCAGQFFGEAISKLYPRLPVAPALSWSHVAVGDGHHVQCSANSEPVGDPFDCHGYGVCAYPTGANNACAGVYYRQAIERIWKQQKP